MKIIRKPEELQKAIEALKKKGKTVGLVPTMGALHAGHISLMKKSVSQNDVTVVSVYVNPIQFGPNEDYERYPRPVEHDIKVCKDNKVDFLFLPTNKTLYNDNFSTYIYNNKLAKIMCGVTRPIHFQGVCTVVSKLFNIAMPTKAYFGLKDYQQYIIVKQMAKDFFLKNKPENKDEKFYKCPNEDCQEPISEYDTYCNSCGFVMYGCVLTGRSILDNKYFKCRQCRNKTIKIEVKKQPFKHCPLCHVTLFAQKKEE